MTSAHCRLCINPHLYYISNRFNSVNLCKVYTIPGEFAYTHCKFSHCLPPSPRLLSVDGCCFWAPDVCVCPSVSLWVRHLYQVKPKLFVDGTPISPPHPEGWKIKGQVQERENATIVSGRNSAAADRTIYFEYIPKYHHHFILLTHVNKNRVHRKQLMQNIKQLT